MKAFIAIHKAYLCYQWQSPIKSRFWILFRRGVLDTKLWDKVCQWLAAGRWFSPCAPVSSINKTDRHNITEILLKVALNTINHKPSMFSVCYGIEGLCTNNGRKWKVAVAQYHLFINMLAKDYLLNYSI
jgi:hypothetical protein